MTINNVDAKRLLEGVCDPIRLEIVFLLGKGKPQNVGEITTQTKTIAGFAKL